MCVYLLRQQEACFFYQFRFGLGAAVQYANQAEAACYTSIQHTQPSHEGIRSIY
jgi:hypothetical protein